MDVLGLRTVLVPPNPGNVSAFGLLTVDVKNDYVRTNVALAESLEAAAVASIYDELTDQARAALTGEGFAEADHQFVRTADLRYFGQAFEVRVAVPEDLSTTDVLGRGRRPRSTPSTARSTATTSRTIRASRSSG